MMRSMVKGGYGEERRGVQLGEEYSEGRSLGRGMVRVGYSEGYSEARGN